MMEVQQLYISKNKSLQNQTLTMLENGIIMINGMDVVSKSGKMDRGMMDIGKMIWRMARVD